MSTRKAANLPREQTSALLAVVVHVVRVHDPVEARADQLPGGVAGDVAQRAVHQQPVVRPCRARRCRSASARSARDAPRSGSAGRGASSSACRRAVMSSTTATPPTTSSTRSPAALLRRCASLPRRSGPTSSITQCRCAAVQISRERVSPLQRGAQQRLDRPPQLGGQCISARGLPGAAARPGRRDARAPGPAARTNRRSVVERRAPAPLAARAAQPRPRDRRPPSSGSVHRSRARMTPTHPDHRPLAAFT